MAREETSIEWEWQYRKKTTSRTSSWEQDVFFEPSLEWSFEAEDISLPEFKKTNTVVTGSVLDTNKVLGYNRESSSGIHSTYRVKDGRCDFSRIRGELAAGKHSKIPEQCSESLNKILDVLGESVKGNPLANTDVAGFAVMEKGIPACVFRRESALLGSLSRIQTVVVTERS